MGRALDREANWTIGFLLWPDGKGPLRAVGPVESVAMQWAAPRRGKNHDTSGRDQRVASRGSRRHAPCLEP